jgi:rhamnose utilization protein RhaD (predicted bifunctional aldolase and dehydrogenase)
MTAPDPSPVDSIARDLLWLSHEMGREDRDLVILSEGSTSAKIDNDRYWVKASGARLSSLSADDVVQCHLPRSQGLLEKSFLDAKEFETELLGVRTDGTAKKPSTELMFHSWLFGLEGVRFIAHAHPITVNQVLCSPQAEAFAQQRMLPDEIIACGAQSVYVPYADPGVPLAREIRAKVTLFMRRSFGRVPRLILLQNHGVIALGAAADSVLATLLMAEKAARVFVGAAILGGPVFMQAHQVQRIEKPPEDARSARPVTRMV